MNGRQNNPSHIIAGLLIAVGLFGAGWQVSNTVYKARLASNVVTVKGFAERDVKADLALLQIGFSTSGDDLSRVYEKADNNGKLIHDFLTKKGLSEDEIRIGHVSVTDSETNQYRTVKTQGNRYIIQGSVNVRSNHVDTIDTALRDINDLVKQGVVLSYNRVEYKYTKLKEIKPEMLREATQNARQAAEQFASDAGSSVGSIQMATQGFFSVQSRDSGDASSESGYDNNTSDINKAVRVVTTVTYYLNK